MAISRVKINNFKCFNGLFEFKLNKGLNILVGNNETGKSTILQAIHVALTGFYEGRNIRNELSQYLFNREVVESYFNSVNNGKALIPPSITIEIFFDGSVDPEFEGNDNSERISCEGLKFQIAFDEKYTEEYNVLVSKKNMISLPIEYYEATWTTFARQVVTTRSIPIKSSMIDSSSYRYQNGSDVYISRIIKDLLSTEEITAVSQAHRKMKDTFFGDPSIKKINDRISGESSMLEGKVALSVDLGTKNAWESSLVTQLNDVPFGFIGKGAQCVMKTELALTHKSAQNSQVILLEEPESHLSFSKLNQLIKAIKEKNNDKQIIISTHSSFVANKLGLENLLLIKNLKVARINELSSADFFKKVSGYDTLRLILCEKAILVEGASDELVVQKAYQSLYNDHLPIEDQVDVISVGTSFLRFLEIAEELNLRVSVVTDNDGDVVALEKKYVDYIHKKKENITICYDEVVDVGTLTIGNKMYNYNTLEPKILKANSNNLSLFNRIFGTNYDKLEDLQKYMNHHKTEAALAIFNSDERIIFPTYIMEAIKNE